MAHADPDKYQKRTVVNLEAALREELDSRLIDKLLPRLGRFKRFFDNPVLDVGAGGEWDDTSVEDPKVLRFDLLSLTEQYNLYYTGRNAAGDYQIGLAQSADPEGPFVKHVANPLMVGTPGTWDGGGVLKPYVLRVDLDYRYYMYYVGLGAGTFPAAQIGLAFSNDLVTWYKYANNPIISVVTDTWEGFFVSEPCVLILDDVFYMIYAAQEVDYTPPVGFQHGRLGLATSPDGLVWTKSHNNPIYSPKLDGSTIGGYSVGDHSIIWLGDIAMMVAINQCTGAALMERGVVRWSLDLENWFEDPRGVIIGRGPDGSGSTGDFTLVQSPDRPLELFLYYEDPVNSDIRLAKSVLLAHPSKIAEHLIDVATIGAGGNETVTTDVLDNAKAVSITVRVTYGAGTAGITVYALSSPDQTNFDSQNATDALTSFSPSYTASQTRQRTILLDVEGIKYLRLVILNDDGAVATGDVDLWMTEHIEAN